MLHMASDPPELFRQAADTVDELLTRVDEIVPKLCTEVLYGCHISDDCRDDPIQALLRAPHSAGERISRGGERAEAATSKSHHSFS